MRTELSLVAWVGVLAVACSESGERRFTLPSGPVGAAPTGPPVSPTPVPGPPSLPPVRSPSPSDVNPLEVGQTFSVVVGPNPPECIDPQNPPGWPCQYFRLIPPADGRLVLTLNYVPETQPTQAVDLSIHEPGQRQIWAEFLLIDQARLVVPVNAGRVYDITVWYTFPGLKYQLRASVEP
jgi:hypothetical protein